MRRLWIAVGILALLLAGTLGNAWYLQRLVDGYEQRLTTAQELAEQGAWTNAAQITDQVFRDWQDREFYFHVLMRHTDTDNILLSFLEVREYLELEELDQYAAANAKLTGQLGLLAEMEHPSLKNIL